MIKQPGDDSTHQFKLPETVCHKSTRRPSSICHVIGSSQHLSLCQTVSACICNGISITLIPMDGSNASGLVKSPGLSVQVPMQGKQAVCLIAFSLTLQPMSCKIKQIRQHCMLSHACSINDISKVSMWPYVCFLGTVVTTCPYKAAAFVLSNVMPLIWAQTLTACCMVKANQCGWECIESHAELSVLGMHGARTIAK